MRPEFRVRPLLLLLAASVAFLTTVQCTRLFALPVSRDPALENVSYAPTPHTREEVGDRGVDFSVDAHNESMRPSMTEAVPVSNRPTFLADIEVASIPPLQVLHRRVSPPSSDDAFTSSLR
jgi:hypothetical protein